MYSYIRNPFSSAAKTIGNRLIDGSLMPLLESVYPLVRAVMGRKSQRKGVPDAPTRGRSVTRQSSRKNQREPSHDPTAASSGAAPAAASVGPPVNRRLRDKTPDGRASSAPPAAAPVARRRVASKGPNPRAANYPAYVPDPAPEPELTRGQKAARTRKANDAARKARADEIVGEILARPRRGRGMSMTTPLVNYGSGLRQTRRGGARTIQGMAPILEFNEAADDPYVMRQQVH